MTLEVWLLFIAVSLAPAISPGPAVFLALSNTLKFGGRATIWSATGNALGLFILGFGAALGLGTIMETSAFAFTILKFIGAAYLIWLGIKTWRDKSGLVEEGQNTFPPQKHKLFSTALIVSLTNPKAIVVILALFPPFMNAEGSALFQAAVLSATYAVLCFLNHLTIALMGGRLKNFMNNMKRIRLVRRVLGATFAGFGALLASAQR
ncbi:lysine transporter LysE [Kiloniella spongiae]|uniref:Lysine transporter LysE n=1 Tax=Kiloniella spongiae TaxID=1489064 RepID=A0A0H2MCF4_9PROT|nr:LysE family translocator [Kiloniella spongiae]KLN60028.1 lysine transporter LysE [Kiloniella spongiae]